LDQIREKESLISAENQKLNDNSIKLEKKQALLKVELKNLQHKLAQKNQLFMQNSNSNNAENYENSECMLIFASFNYYFFTTH
jgi:hypothetical protein